ncbi:MAG: type II toxin-antitoxin system Phd/YefM family antitoxin [Clostridia bacterium]|nr:type II toxin-antitoxin system Phd/YefM family antitoxin [Clostridia bacterium]
MLAVNYTNLRENLKTYMDMVTDDYETMIVTRKDNKNVVMISEEVYNNLMENAYIMGNKANYDWLMESKAQLEKGKFSAHDLIEVDGNE